MDTASNQPDETEDLSESQLKWGYWFTTHRVLFRQILVIGLIVFDAILVSYNLWSWGEYLFRGMWVEKAMMREMARPLVNFSALQEHFSAKPLTIQEVVPLPGANGKADLVARLKNPNDAFFVSFKYRFNAGGLQTPWQKGFLLPQEEKPMVEWGMADFSQTSGATVELAEFVWQRFSPHQIKDMAGYLVKHINFSTESFGFAPAESNILGSRLTFSLVNNTVYGYFEPRFLIMLKSAGNPVGIERVVFDKFAAGEKKSVDLRLSNAGLYPSEIQVIPDINIFDPGIYQK